MSCPFTTSSACSCLRNPKSIAGRSGEQNFRGFTLLELLVVIVIIGLLASYVGPKFFSQIGKSETTVARAQMQAFQKSLDGYRIDVGRYPSTEEGLNALRAKPATNLKWNGPYLSKDPPLDPWGRPYVYQSTSESDGFEISSLGKDGQQGGAGDNADIRVP